MLEDWLEETHSSGFELRRHFFLRFFDSEMVSTPGQWRAVAIGTVAVLLAFGASYIPHLYARYLILGRLPSPHPYRLGILGDILTIVLLAMSVIGLFTAIQWHSLFPDLRDCLALSGLPIRMSEVFVAKFTALLAFAALLTFATIALPSVLLPAIFAGPYAPDARRQIPAIFLTSSLAALGTFCCLVAVQGVLQLAVPARYIGRVSLAAQGALLTAILCGLPITLEVLTMDRIDHPPGWVPWMPPVWFLGLDQAIAGASDPTIRELAQRALVGVAGSAVASVATYWWSYRRRCARLIEAMVPRGDRKRSVGRRSTELLISDPRELAVFEFTAKTLARSPMQRLVLTAFASLGSAIVCYNVAGLILHGDVANLGASAATRETAIAAPLALSLFVLSGMTYLFRLPVEALANWIFRLNQWGNERAFLNAAGRFVLVCAVVPVALLTLPIEIWVLGLREGLTAAVLCLLPSLILMEAFLLRSPKIPFTSSYLPGRRPVIVLLLIYGAAISLYVSALGAIIDASLDEPLWSAVLFSVLMAVWLKLRNQRLAQVNAGELEFEELAEPAVLALGLHRE